MLAFHAAAVPASNSFGVSLKGTRLPCGKEVLVFSYACPTSESPCAMHHYWSGGSFAGYAATRIRYYYDGSMLSLPLGPAHGMSPTSMDDNAPWSAGSLFGKTGKGLFSRPVSVWSELGLGSKGSGLFNNFLVPFAVTMNVTATLGCPQNERGSYWEPFWIILHGHTRAVDLRLTGGLRLPEGARLRSYESPVVTMDPFEFLVIFNRRRESLLTSNTHIVPRRTFLRRPTACARAAPNSTSLRRLAKGAQSQQSRMASNAAARCFSSL